MKTVQFERFGDADVLEVVDLPAPAASPGQVVVDVRAAGTNPGEAAIRSGALEEMFPTDLPCGQGSDFAGIVSALGEGVDSVAVGDEVMGWSEQRSSQAERVAVPVGQVIAKPAQLSWEVAGSLGVAGLTAVACVRAVGAGRGDTVAVSAAAGGVGSIVVQLLRQAGANVVGIAGTGNVDWLRSVGATPVAHGDGLAERLRAAAPEGLDAFVDCFGDGYCQTAIDLGVDPARVNTIIDFAAAQSLGVTAEGAAAIAPEQSAAVLADLAAMIARGEVEITVAATYPLEQVHQAYTELEQRHTRGKIVLIP